MSFLISIIAVLHIPQVQNRLSDNFLKKLSSDTNFTIQKKHFSLKWLHKIVINNFQIKDSEDRIICNIEHVKLDINLIQILWKKLIVIDNLKIKKGKLQICRNKQDKVYNFQTLWDRLHKEQSYTKSTLPKFIRSIAARKIFLKDFSLIIDDQNKPFINTSFDPYHIQIEDITVLLNDLYYQQDTLSGDLQHLKMGYITKKIRINELHTYFQITPYSTTLNNLSFYTEHSYLQSDLIFSYNGIKSFADIQNELYVIAQLKEVKFASQELAYFIPYFKSNATDYILKGKITGNLNKFFLENFYLEFGSKKSYLRGFGTLEGLVNFENAYFDFDLNKCCLYTSDLLPHIDEKHHYLLQKLQLFKLKSTIVGTSKRFITKGDIKTDIGKITTNIELKFNKGFESISYKGNIDTESLHIGKLLGIKELKELTMHAYIDGEGITSKKANFYIKTNIKKIGLQAYNYANIYLEGKLASDFFNGHLNIEDPNLKAQFHTKADWGNHTKGILIKGVLKRLAFHALGFGTKSICVSSEIDIALHGTTWDDFITNANFKNIYLDQGNKPLNIAYLHIKNGRKDGYSTLNVNSDLLDIHAEGAIKYTGLIHDFQEFIHTYHKKLFQQEFIPKYTDQMYRFDYSVSLKDINPLLSLIFPNLYITPRTKIEGFFSLYDKIVFEFHTNTIDSLAISDTKLQKVQWDVKMSHTKQDQLITADAQFTTQKQQWGKYTNTEDLTLNVIWNNHEISFKNTIGNEESKLQLNLIGKATLKNLVTYFNFDDTNIKIGNKKWELHPAGIIKIHKGYINFHNLLLSTDAQQISMEGKWSSKSPEKLVMGITNVELNNFTLFLNKKINGTINGNVVLTDTSIKPKITGSLHINDISIDNSLIGNLYLSATWNNITKRMHVLCQLEKNKVSLIDIKGVYTPTNPTKNLDLVAKFSDAQLVLLEPFVNEMFSELDGTVDGKIHIVGTTNAPLVYGKAALKNMMVKVNYLNVLYKGEGDFKFNSNTIQVQKLRLLDDQLGQANIQGKIIHTYFKNFSLDLAGSIKNLKILNTKYDDNEYFYGKSVATGNISFVGPVDSITITAQGTTKKGTYLFIPVSKYNKKVEQENFIRFVNFKTCKENLVETLLPVQFKGLNLDIKLNITPDAWVNIMLNGKDGDIIQSKGKGALVVKSNAGENLNLTGNYELIEGSYNFSVYELVRRKFKILPGSTITWMDDPYNGILHVKAVYDQRISLVPLLEGIQGKSITSKDKKKYPISVLLALEGVLSAPDMNFEVQFLQLPENPDLQEAINIFQEKTSTDPNYLKNQVFSLVMLKNFSPNNTINFNNNSLQKNVGEVFSQQLNRLATSLDENLEIDTDIDLEELRSEKSTSLPVKISYNFLAGKLVISRESKINFDTDKDVDFANMVGDWSVEYGLNTNNKIRTKIHISPSGLEKNTSKAVFGAISFVYIKSFNRWREVFFLKK